jgi:hypothetical protein
VETKTEWKDAIWVTANDELFDFCKKLVGFDEISLSLRLNQFLGLPPQRQSFQIVEYLVAPGHLVRPCIDPEIHDDVCDVPADVSDLHSEAPQLQKSKFRAGFLEWFRYRSVNTFIKNSEDGYPWTRYGYTYDYANDAGRTNPRAPFGASEYVIAPNSSITFIKMHPIMQFCQLGEQQ